jgi:hypothetical protein
MTASLPLTCSAFLGSWGRRVLGAMALIGGIVLVAIPLRALG